MPKSTLTLRTALPSDSVELIKFFESIPLLGPIEIKIGRQDHFFSFYERLQLPFKTYVLEDHEVGQILGSVGFLFHHVQFENTKMKLAQACDLRVSSNRRALIGWSHFFQPVLENLQNDYNIHEFITTINHSDLQSVNAFIRPKLKRAHQPSYSLIRKFNLVTIHGFFPWRLRPNKNITVRSYQASDKEKLVEYITKKIEHFDMIPVLLKKSVSEYIDHSILYSWSQFLIAFDPKGQIIGCVQPLSSSLLQDYLPQNYNSQAHNFRQFLKFASWLQIGRTLTRPFSRTQKQQSLKFRMLHFLFFEHVEVFYALLRMAYDTSSQKEFLIYAYDKADFKRRPPKGSINAEMPYGLHSINIDGQSQPQELSLRNTKPLWLDGLWF